MTPVAIAGIRPIFATGEKAHVNELATMDLKSKRQLEKSAAEIRSYLATRNYVEKLNKICLGVDTNAVEIVLI
jgi:hypothetical protein